MEMRRSDRQLSTNEAYDILEKGEYGVLSTIGEDGFPYGVPVSYAYDREKNSIYIHGAANVGHKYQNICFSNKVCFTVVGATEILSEKFSTKYESVIAFGEVSLPQDKMPALMALVKKYSAAFEEKGKAYASASLEKVSVYEIKIESLTAKGRKNR